MKTELYSWVKNLAVFYITLTAAAHLIPEKGYEKYIRFFMGILLVLMLCVPVFSVLGQSEKLLDAFEKSFSDAMSKQQMAEENNIQEIWLKKEVEHGLEKYGFKEEAYSDKIFGNIGTAMGDFTAGGDSSGSSDASGEGRK